MNLIDCIKRIRGRSKTLGTITGRLPCNKPYKDTVTLDQILKDGWSRGFNPKQTIDEAAIMGFTVTKETLEAKWSEYEDIMQAHFEATGQKPKTTKEDLWPAARHLKVTQLLSSKQGDVIIKGFMVTGKMRGLDRSQIFARATEYAALCGLEVLDLNKAEMMLDHTSGIAFIYQKYPLKP